MMGGHGTALRGYLDRRAPGYLVLFVTPHCNCRCQMCFHTAVLERAAERQVLTIAEIERIARRWPGLHNLNLSGGEPFLRPDLEQIPTLFYRHAGTRFITCTTNSSRPAHTEAVVRRICEACPDAAIRIAQSLDGVGERHDSIRGRPGLFDRVVELNQRLAGLARRHPNLGRTVVTVLSSLNLGHEDELLDHVYRQLSFDDYGALFVRGHTLDPRARQLEGAAFQRFQQACIRRAEQRSVRRGFAVSLYTALNQLASELVMQVATEDRFVTPCVAGRAMVVMDDEGRVEPCEVLGELIREGRFELDSSELGSIRAFDYDVRQLLATRRARHMADTIVRRRCYCSYECAMAANVLYTPRLLLRALGRAGRRWRGGRR